MSVERRETDSGEVRWDVRLRTPGGKQYKRTFRTKREAQRFESTELADRARGNWIDPRAGQTTVGEWFVEWYESNTASWRPSTAAKNRSAIVKHWLPPLGSRHIASLSPRHVQQVVNELGRQHKASTVRSYYAAFRAMVNSAVDMELIGRSPCRGVKLPAPDADEKRVVTPVQLHVLADAIGMQWRTMIYLAGVLGLRFGEVIALQLADVDLEQRRLRINKAVAESAGRLDIGPPKTAASNRTLDVPLQLVDELRRHIDLLSLQQADDLLFADRFGGPLRASNFRDRTFVPAVQAAGLDGLTFHGLRHSAATIWMASGADARTVQHLLGHTDPSLVLRLYAHASDDAVRRAGDKAARLFWNSESGTNDDAERSAIDVP